MLAAKRRRVPHRKTYSLHKSVNRRKNMKFLTLLLVLGMLIALFAGSSEGSFCPCDLKTKGSEVCGSNGVTFKNRCEFECSQRDYKKLGRTLNIRNEGPCSSTI
ncbi:uncharacterized protein LOC26535341 [Drosophila yakuba]|uniref:Kazal-like domain-containing protein n=2 Tax=Drosophila yakuba TaxID=7245 RepID=B4P1K7_DROYA|nr:uncharacterized protein LOC26535341 [Drosophila yakuba]EDW88114.2 uncharacterized protein Dyak_GE18545 [Drosophila yakuba]